MLITGGVTIDGSTLFAPPPPPGGSLESSFSILGYANSSDWNMGTGDFTVEWFGFQTNANQGTWFGFSSGDSLEAATSSNAFTLYNGGTLLANIGIAAYTNVWIHWAITRSNNVIRIFRAGTQISTDISNSSNLTTSGRLRLGIGNTNLVGRFTQFNWVKGTALYTSNFTPPSQPLNANPNSKLLLLVKSDSEKFIDSSGTGKTPDQTTGISYNSSSPFNS